MKKFFTAFSFLFTSISASAQYCVPAPGTDGCTDGDMIDNFILFGENNTSIINILTGCSAGAYADLTAQSVSLGQGTGYVATISTQYVPDDNVAIWIDFNNNDVFELTELIGLQTNISLTGSPVPLVIPGTAPLGTHRMRVSLRYDVQPIDQDPCNTGINASDFGEAHDYTVNVVAAPTCTQPGSVTVSNITSSSATATWSGTASLYSIEYGPAGFTPGTGIYSTTSSTTANLGGLNANTGYSVYVRALCSSSDSSTISSAMFTTLCAPINVPYAENFDAVITPDIPACMTVEDVNNDQTTWMTDSYIASSLPNAMHYWTDFSNTANDWFFTPGLNLTAGNTYQVSFAFGTDGFATEAMEVKVGTSPLASSMTGTALYTNNNITNTGFMTASVNYMPLSTGVYYFGWHCTSAALADVLAIDDISITQIGTTGITPEATANSMNLAVYPNPVKNTAIIELAEPGKNAGLQITELSGRVLQNVAVTSRKTEVDMSSFAPGIYLLRYSDDTRSQVMKVVKQ